VPVIGMPSTRRATHVASLSQFFSTLLGKFRRKKKRKGDDASIYPMF
jgi:hypothetical protein